jgi:hypothetical protein
MSIEPVFQNEDGRVDHEEVYYHVEREFQSAGHDVTLLDEALDDNSEGAYEFLDRVAHGEDMFQLASEYEFIDG